MQSQKTTEESFFPIYLSPLGGLVIMMECVKVIPNSNEPEKWWNVWMWYLNQVNQMMECMNQVNQRNVGVRECET